MVCGLFLACRGTALCESPGQMMCHTCALCPEAFSMYVSEQFQCGENNDMRENSELIPVKFQSLEVMLLGLAI